MKKFITIYAILDPESQVILSKLQNSILAKGYQGSQTMNIPFHISIGSYQLEEKEKQLIRLEEIAKMFKPFEIEVNSLADFNNQVLYAKPTNHQNILKLRSYFNNDYKKHPFMPHITIFQDSSIRNAYKIIKDQFKPFKAKIVGLELGEFFPAKILKTCYFIGGK